MIEFYPNSIYYPREAVEEKLAKGELDKTEKHLMGWTERHRGEIWDCARDDAENPTDEILLDNLRALLLCKGSLQPAAEMGDMIKEIKKEVWYRNEKEHEAAEEVAGEIAQAKRGIRGMCAMDIVDALPEALSRYA